MADYNLNFTRTFIFISVMYYILDRITQLIRMHMYNTRVHDSSYVLSGCHGVTPLTPYVIDMVTNE